MKLYYHQLEAQLAKGLSPIYIISGDELFLKQEAVQMIRKAAKKAGVDERIRLSPEAGFDWEQLYAILHSPSLFAARRLIELDFRDANPNKVASNILQTYSSEPSSDNTLLLDIAKIDDKIAKSAWYKALEKVSVVVTIWPIPREQLPQWIMQRVKKYKLQISLAAANLLADYTEGNLVAAAQIIEKMYLMRPENSIDEELIACVLTDESHFSVFDLVDSFVNGDQLRSLHILTSLQADGIEAVMVLWALTRELRTLNEMAIALANGENYESLFKKHRIFAKRQPSVRKILSKTKAETYWTLIHQALAIDQMIKGARPGNPWENLQLFCLRI